MSAFTPSELRRILRNEQNEMPTDDFRILNSSIEYQITEKPKDSTETDYLCYEFEVINPDTGEISHLYKAIKFLRIIRLPKDAKQSTSFMDMQAQILSAVYENQYNLITVIANIIEPVPLGLLFLYGVQGIGVTLDDAKEKARRDYIGLCSTLQGTFRVLHFRTITVQEAEWLKDKLFSMKYLTMTRGIPKASKTGENMGNKGMGGGNLNPDSQGTLEEFITGMVSYEYVIEILITPVFYETLTAWQTRTQLDMTNWNGQLQGTNNLSANLSMPMMYMANAGSSEGFSHGYTDTDSTSYSTGESFNTGYGESVGQNLAQTYGQSIGESNGVSSSDSLSSSHSISAGTSEGKNFGTSETLGTSSGISHSTGTSESSSQSSSESYGSSNNYGESITKGENAGQTTGKTLGESISQGQTLSHGASVGTSENVGSSNTTSISSGESESSSWNSAETESESYGWNASSSTSQNIGGSESNSTSVSNGVSSSESETSSTSTSVSDSHSDGVSSGLGGSNTKSDGTSKGISSTNSESNSWSVGASGNVSVPVVDIGVGGGYSEGNTSTETESYGETGSESTGHGTSFNRGTNSSDSYSSSSSDSTSHGTTNGSSYSNGTSHNEGTSWGTGTSDSNGESGSVNHGYSNGTSGGFGVSNSESNATGVSQGKSASTSQSNSESFNVGSSQSLSNSITNTIGNSLSSGYTESMGDSHSIGSTSGKSVGNTISDGTSQSSSRSTGKTTGNSVSLSNSESSGLTTGSSIGKTQSVSNTTSASTSAGQSATESSNVTNGTSTSKGTSNAQGLSMATTGAMTTGASGSMGLGPSIGYSKAYQWVDQQVQDILELLTFQNERIKAAMRTGAFYTYAFIACPSRAALAAAQSLAKSTWQNDSAMVQPLQVMNLVTTEQEHLLNHFSAFSSDVTRIEHYGVSEYKYCTLLLPEELVAYTHLPRVSFGGIYAEVNDLPKFAVPSMMEGEIYMGSVVSSERYSMKHGYITPYDFRLKETELMHGFFTGASRSGKTVAAMRFVKGLTGIRRKKTGKRLRIVCMDPKQDWRGLANFVEPERFRFYSMGNPNFHPLKFNPCKIPRGVIPQIWVDVMIEIYCRAYGLLERGKQLMAETFYSLYEEAGVFDVYGKEGWEQKVSDLSANVTFTAAYERMELYKRQMDDGTSSKGRGGNDTKDAYARLLERLSAFSREYSIERRLFGEADGLGIDEIIGDDDVTVLESKGLESTFRSFIFGVITAGFYRYAIAQEKGYLAPDQYETVLVIEEANEVLTGSDTAGTGKSGMGLSGQSEFEQMLDQSAGYGLFIIAITQKIADMPKSIIANSGLVFAGKVKSEDDINVIVKTIGRDARYDDRDVAKFLPKAMTGWFICQSSRTFSMTDIEPVLVQIAPLNSETPSNDVLDNLLLKNNIKKHIAQFENSMPSACI